MSDARWQPDWQRIQQGRPFSTKGLEDRQMTPLKSPFEVPSRGAAMDLCAKHGVALYPAGEYELRMGGDGKLWLLHTEWHRRAQVFEYQRDTQRSEAVSQFRDADYDQRVGDAYDKREE
jgi:hypothetical protein